MEGFKGQQITACMAFPRRSGGKELLTYFGVTVRDSGPTTRKGRDKPIHLDLYPFHYNSGKNEMEMQTVGTEGFFFFPTSVTRSCQNSMIIGAGLALFANRRRARRPCCLINRGLLLFESLCCYFTKKNLTNIQSGSLSVEDSGYVRNKPLWELIILL